MDAGDERFGVVHREGIYLRPVGFPKPSATEVHSRIFMEWPIPISEIEGAFQHAHGIVVGLLTPAVVVCDTDKTRVTHLGENELAETGAPHSIDDLSISGD